MEIVLSTSGILYPNRGRGINVDLSELEQQFVHLALRRVYEDDSLSDKLAIDQRSSNYKTVSCYTDYDFLRFKISPRSLWFSIVPNPNDKRDQRFDSVKNKRTIHWKIELSSIDDVDSYSDLILNSAFYALNKFQSV